MAQKGAAKKTHSAAEAAEAAVLQNRPTKHYCKSPKCHNPSERILLKDLQPAGEPKKPMKMYHKSCYKVL